MATSSNELMEIDSDDESLAKKAKCAEKTDEDKAMEIILIDEDSEDERTDKKDEERTDKEEEKESTKGKNENETKSVSPESKGEPTIHTDIIDIKDDDDDEEEVKEVKEKIDVEKVKEVFVPKSSDPTVREGVIIKDVEEITNNKAAEKKVIDEVSVEYEEEITVEDLDPETQANRLKCLNSSCKSGDDLAICKESLVFTFYGMKPRGNRLVCKACCKAADEHFEELVSLLKDKKPLFSANYPPCSDIVLLEDSDEENEDDFEGEELELSDEVMEIVNNNILLENLIKETLNKCGLDEQMKENKRLLEIEAENVEAEIKELDERFENSFNELDRLRSLLYKDFQPKVKNLPPIEIVDIQQPVSLTQKQSGLSSAAACMPASLRRATGQPSSTAAAAGSSSNRPVAVAIKKVTQYASNASTSKFRTAFVSNEQDVMALDAMPSSLPPLPPFGVLQRPRLAVGESVYVMRQSLFTAWGLARVVEILPKRNDNSDATQLRVEYDLTKRTPPTKLTTGKLVAYHRVSAVRLPVGSRVIAVYRGDDDATTPSQNHYFYSGIVAEAPKVNNNFRYLVFFDDGYTQYVYHENIRLVCENSKNVWEDVHPESKQFIKDYLTRYPERPMVKLTVNEIVKTEWNGKWWVARVQAIDASLVKMYFDADERTEWIYRGSTRLGPLFIEMMAARDRQSGKSRHASILKRQSPYVEYTQNLDESNSDDDVELVKVDSQQQTPCRSVARKSTNRTNQKSDEVYHKVGPVDISVKPKQYVPQEHPGSIVKVSLSNAMKPKPFQRHSCNNSCVAWTKYTTSQSKEIPCLLRPLKFGFQRLFYTRKSKPFVVYIGPCGRRIRNHEEMIRYLFKTQSQLSCDYFDFDTWVSCVNEYKLLKTNTSIKDLSYGKENVSIECVNYVDHTYPDFVYYQTERRAMENVKLNTGPEFLSGCDCVDNCQDRSKCSCWQLTINGAKCVPGVDFDENNIGYQYRRLPERVVSGIYECNSQCKCSSTCLNRVVQFPLCVKLQLYKTLMKGWGIRCLHDIPQGSFICIYAGNLLTEQAANEGGKTYGDEYLAELDFIEVIENLKDDYESDVPESSEEESDSNDKNRGRRMDKGKDREQEEDVDDPQPIGNERDRRKGGYETDSTFSVSSSRINNNGMTNNMRDRLRTRETAKNKSRNSDSDNSCDSNGRNDESRQPAQFSANILEDGEKKRHKSVREYYGDGDCIYIMDAKNSGNIGRYMNHSCNPNVFVQNVFVDTHDLRFPWVAFFASRFIDAGKELTWDYNYDVGSVPGKALHCYCGEANCRRRLL